MQSDPEIRATGGVEPLAILVLHTPGCAATPPTIELIRRVMSGLDIQAEITTMRVESQEQAEHLRFVGSPTVQINGVDIDPLARSSSHFGLG